MDLVHIPELMFLTIMVQNICMDSFLLKIIESVLPLLQEAYKSKLTVQKLNLHSLLLVFPIGKKKPQLAVKD